MCVMFRWVRVPIVYYYIFGCIIECMIKSSSALSVTSYRQTFTEISSVAVAYTYDAEQIESMLERYTSIAPHLDFDFSERDHRSQTMEKIFTTPYGLQNDWVMCLTLIDQFGNDIDGTEQCGLPSPVMGIPIMFSCTDFTVPNGNDFHFHLTLKRHMPDPGGLLNEESYVDMKYVFLERVLSGSGYDVNEEGNFEFTLPLDASPLATSITSPYANISIVIDPNDMFQEMFTSVKTAVNSVSLLAMSSATPILDGGSSFQESLATDGSTSIDMDTTLTTYNMLDHIVSHLGNIPLCIPTSSQATEKRARILIIGDSHSSLFFNGKSINAYELPTNSSRSFHLPKKHQYVNSTHEYQSLENPCVESNYQVCHRIGATAYGLKNMNSATKSCQVFEKCIQKFRHKMDYIGIMLGEVDMRLGSKRRVDDFQQMIQSAEILFQFISNITNKFELNMNQVILIATPHRCPLVPGVAVTEPSVTMRYNMMIEKKCRELGCLFADPTDDLVDYHIGQVKEYFWSEPKDPHCTSHRTYYFYHRAIQRAANLDWCGM